MGYTISHSRNVNLANISYGCYNVATSYIIRYTYVGVPCLMSLVNIKRI